MKRVDEFWVVSTGSTAGEAFSAAVRTALAASPSAELASGIGTKDDYVILVVPSGQEPEQFARELLQKSDERIADGRGRACCIALGTDQFLFFGRCAD